MVMDFLQEWCFNFYQILVLSLVSLYFWCISSLKKERKQQMFLWSFFFRCEKLVVPFAILLSSFQFWVFFDKSQEDLLELGSRHRIPVWLERNNWFFKRRNNGILMPYFFFFYYILFLNWRRRAILFWWVLICFILKLMERNEFTGGCDFMWPVAWSSFKWLLSLWRALSPLILAI